MHLSEEKRAVLRKCFENFQSNIKKKKSKSIQGVYQTEEIRKVGQILFDARDGKEVFTPF